MYCFCPRRPIGITPRMTIDTTLRRKPRTLALELVESLGDRIRDGRLALGDKLPT